MQNIVRLSIYLRILHSHLWEGSFTTLINSRTNFVQFLVFVCLLESKTTPLQFPSPIMENVNVSGDSDWQTDGHLAKFVHEGKEEGNEKSHLILRKAKLSQA